MLQSTLCEFRRDPLRTPFRQTREFAPRSRDNRDQDLKGFAEVGKSCRNRALLDSLSCIHALTEESVPVLSDIDIDMFIVFEVWGAARCQASEPPRTECVLLTVGEA